MQKNSTNSFQELDREAHDLVDLARFCRLPTLPAELHTTKLRTDLARLFVEEKATDQNIAELVAGFRQSLIEAQCPVEMNSFIGAIVGLAARIKENADTTLVNQFEPELREALTAIGAHDKFSWSSMMMDKQEQLQENISALMHATMAVCNFDLQQMAYA